jgi:hypothetical protein
MSAIFKMAAKTRHKKWAGKIQHCPISSKFDMWVDNDVPTLKKILPVAIFKMATTIPQKFNIVQYHQNLICGYIMMSQIDSRQLKISTGCHFENGLHNASQIQHCSISTKFHM